MRGTSALVWVAVFLLLLILTTLLPLPADAHTAEEHKTWEEDWYARVAEQGVLSPDLVAELTDWVDRHPEHYQPAYTFTPTGSYDTGSWESLIIIYFDEADWPWARRVMACESNGDPDAYNSSSGASGLFQFIPSTWSWAKPWPGADPFNPTANVMAAAWLLDELGPTQWSCR